MVERLLIMIERDVIDGADVRAVVQPGQPGQPVERDRVTPAGASATPGPVEAAPDNPADSAGTLREFKEATERAWLVAKLRENAWNISKTAEVIDTPRSNLYKKLEQYRISQETDG